MGFFHIKELRQHCRELKRDLERATRDVDRAKTEKEERAGMRWIARIERDMREIEKLTEGWPKP